MDGEAHKCSSCGVTLETENCTVFKCPDCGQAMIGRCYHCRDQSVPYECSNCGMRGP